jgi:multiple sugar transport system substrate-binding protein
MASTSGHSSGTLAHAAQSAIDRRTFLQLAGTLAAGSLLTACTPFWSSPTHQSNPVQLAYQDWGTGGFPAMAQRMLEHFHAENPDIKVFFVPDPEDFANKMVSDFQGGTAPDVFQGCCVHFPAWAQEGYALDLRPYVEENLSPAIIKDWNPAQYRSFFLKDGLQFGLPKYHGALALYYNKDVFDEFGVEYPTATWDHDDYAQAMAMLTHDRNGDGGTDLWGSMLDVSWDRIQVHVNGWGGHLVDPEDPNTCLMSAPEALAAMDWIRGQMWDERVMATPLDVQNMSTRQAFISGRVAMVEDGSWALKDILTGADFRIGVAPLPAGPARRVTLASTDGLGIYASTPHPDAAWKLLEFLISEDYGRAMAREVFLQPARASLVNDWIGYIRQAFPEKTEDMDLAAFADGHIKGYSVTSETFSNMAEAKRATYAAWEQIFVLGQAPVELMLDVCEQLESAPRGLD